MATANFLTRAVATGALVGIATAAVAAALGRRHGGAAGPINGTSHILWGDADATTTRVDARHTGTGLALNAGAAFFWALVYEALFGGRSASRAALGGPAVSALAYVTDYHLVPQRLTPGWELQLPRRELAILYAVLAASLPLRALIQTRRISR